MLRIGTSALALGLVLTLWPQPPLRSQDAPVEAQLELLRHPPWHEPGDRLGLVLAVTNTGAAELQGFRLHVALYPRVTSRSQLHDSFDGIPTFDLGSFPVEIARALAPGEMARIAVAELVDTFVVLQGAESGIYPLTVSLLEPNFTPLDSLTTELVFLSSRPKTRLNLVPLVTTESPPERGPDNVFRSPLPSSERTPTLAPNCAVRRDPGPPASSNHGPQGLQSDCTVSPINLPPPLSEAAAPGGWLYTLIAGLEQAAEEGLRFGFAPTPRLVEEITDIASGYRRSRDSGIETVSDASEEAAAARAFLQRLRTLFRSPQAQLVLTPYAYPHLPALARNLPPDMTVQHLADHLARGEKAIADATEVRVARHWLYPPRGSLDALTLEELRKLGEAEFALVSEQSLVPPIDLAGCPSGSPTFACPIRLETGAGSTTGYALDQALQERLVALARPGDDALDLQRFIAETAMVWAELPGLSARVIATALPGSAHLTPGVVTRLFTTLARVPWLKTVTPAQGLVIAGDPAEREATEALRPALQGEPNGPFWDALARAQAAVDSFASARPPAQVVERLRRNLLVAESRAWWDDGLAVTGRSYITETLAAAEGTLSKISIGGTDDITLTSRRGRISLTVFNQSGYPLTLAMRLSAQQLALKQPSLREFLPDTTPVTVDVTAHSSGIFPLAVTLATPDGHVVYGPKFIAVRSTEFNEIALVITIGALAFLIAFYVFRSFYRRTSPPESPKGPPGNKKRDSGEPAASMARNCAVRRDLIPWPTPMLTRRDSQSNCTVQTEAHLGRALREEEGIERGGAGRWNCPSDLSEGPK